MTLSKQQRALRRGWAKRYLLLSACFIQKAIQETTLTTEERTILLHTSYVK